VRNRQPVLDLLIGNKESVVQLVAGSINITKGENAPTATAFDSEWLELLVRSLLLCLTAKELLLLPVL